MKLKNNIATRQKGYNELHATELKNLTDAAISFPKTEEEMTPDMEVTMRAYFEKVTQFNLDQMEYVLVPETVDELCEMVEKIGQLVTVDKINIEDMGVNEIISLAIMIIRLDDAASEEEVAEKKKIA